MKENKARKHARALQSQSSELTIYTDLTPTCYFVKVIASPIDQVDRVVEGALAKDGFLRSEYGSEIHGPFRRSLCEFCSDENLNKSSE